MERYEPGREDNMTGGNPIPENMKKRNDPANHPTGNSGQARDGFDNTGTQGYDSLSDDGYSGSSGSAGKKGSESHTGSATSDFSAITPREKGMSKDDEDAVLNSGI